MAQFLNPLNLAPKLPAYNDGFMSGILRNQERENYDTLLNQSMTLQKLGTMGEAVGLQEKVLDMPLNAAKRDFSIAEMGAKRPFLQEVAQADMENRRLDLDKKKQLHTPGIENALRKFRQEASDEDWQKYTRSTAVMEDLVTRGMAMGPEGPAFVRSQLDRLKTLGYDVPEAIANPQLWPQLRQGLTQTLAHMRAMEIEKTKKDADLERERLQQAGADRRSNAQIAAQDRRAKEAIDRQNARENEPRNEAQALQRAFRTVNNPNASQADRAVAENTIQWYSEKEIDKTTREFIGNDMSLQSPTLSPEDRQARVLRHYNTARTLVQERIKSFAGVPPPDGGKPSPTNPGERSGTIGRPQSVDDRLKRYLQ